MINRRFKGVLSYCENKSLPETGIPNLFYLFYFYFYYLYPILHIFHMFGGPFQLFWTCGKLSSPPYSIGSCMINRKILLYCVLQPCEDNFLMNSYIHFIHPLSCKRGKDLSPKTGEFSNGIYALVVTFSLSSCSC